jgi:hypothetical protein
MRLAGHLGDTAEPVGGPVREEARDPARAVAPVPGPAGRAAARDPEVSGSVPVVLADGARA